MAFPCGSNASKDLKHKRTCQAFESKNCIKCVFCQSVPRVRTYLPFYLHDHLCNSPPVFGSSLIHKSIHQSIRPSVHPSIRLSTGVSRYISVLVGCKLQIEARSIQKSGVFLLISLSLYLSLSPGLVGCSAAAVHRKFQGTLVKWICVATVRTEELSRDKVRRSCSDSDSGCFLSLSPTTNPQSLFFREGASAA